MSPSATLIENTPSVVFPNAGQRNPLRHNLLEICFWGAVLAWCSIPLSPNATDSDFWGHVQYGRDMLRHGLPATSTYTYTAVGYPWVNHEILSEGLFAICADHWGSGSLVALKSLTALVMMASMIWQARRQGSGIFSTALTMVVIAWSVSYYWSTRPQVVSFLFFGLMIACLTRALPKWTRDPDKQSHDGECPANSDLLIDRTRPNRSLGWLISLIPLMVLWTNFHGGFLAGIAVLLAYLGLRSFEYAISSRGKELGFCLRCLCLGGACITVTLLNPYGPQLHAWLIDSLIQPRPEVIEWRPLLWWSLESLPAWTLCGLMLLSFAGAMIDRKTRRVDWVHWILLLITAWQVAEHRRHLPFLAILCGYWLPTPLSQFLRYVHQKVLPSENVPFSPTVEVPEGPIGRTSITAMRAVACSVLLLVTLHWTYQWWQRIQTMQVARNAFPVSAFQFMADHQLQGKLFSTGRWGQYALAVFGAREPNDPGIRVGFDGRYDTCYPRSVVDVHFDFTMGTAVPSGRYRGSDSPPPEPARALELNHPDYLLLDRREPHALRVVESKSSDWSLLYQDSLAQIWGRSEEVNQPMHARFIPAEDRRISDVLQQGWVRWPADPNQKTFVSQTVTESGS